jgi:hypothetical protein
MVLAEHVSSQELTAHDYFLQLARLLTGDPYHSFFLPISSPDNDCAIWISSDWDFKEERKRLKAQVFSEGKLILSSEKIPNRSLGSELNSNLRRNAKLIFRKLQIDEKSELPAHFPAVLADFNKKVYSKLTYQLDICKSQASNQLLGVHIDLDRQANRHSLSIWCNQKNFLTFLFFVQKTAPSQFGS